MDEDSMYPDSEDEPKPSKDKHASKDKDVDTELLSKKFLGMDEDDEADVGKKCTIEVVKDWGDQVEVKYVKSDKKKDREDSDEEMSADDEIDEIESDSMKGKSYAGM